MIVVKNLNIFEYVSLNSNVKLSMWIVILFLHSKIEVRIVNWKTFSFYFNLNQSTNKSFVRRHGLKHSGGRRCKKPTDLSKEYLQDTVLELVMLLISQLAVFASLHLSKNNCWWWTFKQKRETIPKKTLSEAITITELQHVIQLHCFVFKDKNKYRHFSLNSAHSSLLTVC